MVKGVRPDVKRWCVDGAVLDHQQQVASTSARWSYGMNSASMPLCTFTHTCGFQLAASARSISASGSLQGPNC
jgi:hypothetical protein